MSARGPGVEGTQHLQYDNLFFFILTGPTLNIARPTSLTLDVPLSTKIKFEHSIN